MNIIRTALLCIAALLMLPDDVQAKTHLPGKYQIASRVVSKLKKWEVPTEPLKIVGPLYFVGTEGLGVFLFKTGEGLILMNTGLPSSAPMIIKSICTLGLDPHDIKIMINGHAHIDHAGAFARLKEEFGAQLAVMDKDVAAMESGDNADFSYGDDLAYPPVKVDRVLHDGDTVTLGKVTLTAYRTPGHTPGATTWVTNIMDDDKKSYLVVFPDGAGVNPNYKLVNNPAYPDIVENYRGTFARLEMLKPDIWLAQHNEFYGFDRKRKLAKTIGVNAWMDANGYKDFVAKMKRKFEKQLSGQIQLSSKQHQGHGGALR